MSQNLKTDEKRSVLLATFFVRGALCGLDAAGIQEVIRVGAVTPVRHAPDGVAGIVNLRGRIVTILDLGLRLGLEKIVVGRESRIFIVEHRHEFIGLLVDQVAEVLEVDPEAWQVPPANVSWSQARYFKGIWRWRDRVVTILDTDSILAESAVAVAGR